MILNLESPEETKFEMARRFMMNKHMGSKFDDFLEDEGILSESEAEATKRVIAWQIQNYLDMHGLKKSAFAKVMHTNRS